jgi:hypothetical protein
MREEMTILVTTVALSAARVLWSSESLSPAEP